MSKLKNPNRKPRKKPTIQQEVEKAAVLLQKLVRLKASNKLGFCECVTCGVKSSTTRKCKVVTFMAAKKC